MAGENESRATSRTWVLVAVAWTLVGIPLLWGVYNTVKKALALFE